MPPVALFVATGLALALTGGFGLGLWLLLARLFQVPLGEASWLALVQVHGLIQLFGFVGMFVTGVGLHLIPRLRGAPVPSRGRQLSIYALMLGGVLLRTLAQPSTGLPGRELWLALGALLLVGGALLFAFTVLRTLASGTNPHRADELVIAAAISLFPVAAALTAYGAVDGWPLIVPAATQDRGTWLMLLGCAPTLIFGIWARLAPAFVAARPAPARPLLVGAGAWIAGAVGLSAGLRASSALLLLGLVLVTVALGLWGPTIARQPLAGHARLTRLGMRSAFACGLAGALVLCLGALGALPGDAFLVDSAVRHAFALGFLTLSLYGVAARALPTFLGRRLWRPELQVAAIVLTTAAVALRVTPQVLGLTGILPDSAVAASGVLALVGLVAFAANVLRTVRGAATPEIGSGPRSAAPITFS